MRLLHIIHSMNPANGGTTEAVRILIDHVPADHVVATVDSPGDSWANAHRGRLRALGPGKGQFGYCTAYSDWLKENIREFDGVIVHGLWQYPGLAARVAALKADVPYFVYPHGMLDPWFARADPLKHLLKCAIWPLNDYRVLRDARAVLFTAEEEALLARGSFRPYRCTEKIVTLGISRPEGNPAELKAAFFTKHPELREKRLILFLGRIDPKKGLDLLIKAFAGAREPWCLILAGPFVDPAYREAMSQLALRIAPAGSVAWTGMLTGAAKWGALHAADVFALPSHQENFGLAVAEALACGLPVLISDKVNIWREIDADKAGLVGADDEVGTASTLKRWFALNEVQRDEMRRNARECFARRYEIGRAAQLFVEALRDSGVRS